MNTPSTSPTHEVVHPPTHEVVHRYQVGRSTSTPDLTADERCRIGVRSCSMALDPADERHQIDEVITRLAADRCGSRQSIAKVVDAAYDRFAGTRIRDYIPLLVERAAARDLRKA